MSDTIINDLNDDCLMNIFSRLTFNDRLKMGEVCQRWLDVESRGWPHVKCLKLKLCNQPPDYLKTVLHRCGRFLKSLDITIFGEEQLLELQEAADYCSELKILKLECYCYELDDYLYDFVVDNDCLLHIFAKLQKLHTVELRCWGGDILDEHFSRLSAPDLKILSMYSIGTTLFSVNVSRFSNLRTLNLSCMNITEASIRDFEKLQSLIALRLRSCNVPVEFPNKIASLKNLELLELKEETRETQFYDHHISAIARGCPELRYLSLNDMKGVTDTCFNDIAQLSKLQTLIIRHMSNVTDSSIVHMNQIHNLLLYYCNGITVNGLQQLIVNSPELRLLKFMSCEDSTPIVEEINEAMLRRESSRPLTLELDSITMSHNPPNLSPSLVLKSHWKSLFG